MNREFQQQLAAKIVDDLARNQIPWKRTWTAQKVDEAEKVNSNVGMPTNCASGRPYSGVNFLNLNMAAQYRGYGAKWWGTRKQWERKGGRIKDVPDHIRASDWPVTVCLYRPTVSGQVGFLKKWEVYNVEQVDGPFHLWQVETGMVRDVNYRLAEDVIAATNADIRFGGMKAVYHRDPEDCIDCPYPQQFINVRYYYATLFHELMHWAESRVGWTGSYALGELVAEIGAIIACEMAGIPPGTSPDLWENHMTYLNHWLKELGEDASAIFRVTNQAFRTAMFVFSFYNQKKRMLAA